MSKLSLVRTLLISSVFFSSLGAQAALTPDSSGDYVFSSESSVNWTQDGNLLGTMISNDASFINTLISTYGANVYGTGRQVTVDDFGPNSGQVKWEAAMAFVDYLNDNSFGGLTNWRLPSLVDTSQINDANPTYNGVVEGDEYAELYYAEFGGTFNDVADVFSNEQNASYWTSTISPLGVNSGSSVDFKNASGFYGSTAQSQYRYAWAVSSVASAPIPEPATYAMLLAGVGLLSFATRRKS